MGGRIICVVGTRPEVIKMAPVIRALEAAGHEPWILATAQHRHLLDQMLQVFGLRSDWDLDLMQAAQSPASLTGRMLPALDAILAEAPPDLVMAQGDTATVFTSALAAFYRGLPFAHVEAGLRSGDLSAPFPEEGLRRLTAQITALHFAPTDQAKRSLLREGIPEGAIEVVGNSVIDALLATVDRSDLPEPRVRGPFALVTLHRRESFGRPIREILEALRTLARAHPEYTLLYPVHPNPQVHGPAYEILGGVPNVSLCDPLDYLELVAHLRVCHAVFTDSGGLQEEGPALGKPVLVFRDTTERPEAVEAGGARLVGSDPVRFLAEAERLLTDPDHYAAFARPRFPYGDGRTGPRIAARVSGFLAGRRP
ncbi:MAG TPA: UDP-N-acetylglucosamine 2-epimerase (non-hydrolyzing) [Holophagaceae bacterium]